MFSLTIYGFLLQITSRVGLARDEGGQTTAEYAMVIVAAAVIGALLIAWAGKTGVRRQALRRHARTRDQVGGKLSERGQATVETAVVLVLVMILLLLLVQAAVVVRDKIAVMHTARDAAREASVGASSERVAAVVHSVLPHATVHIVRGHGIGTRVSVEVSHRIATDLPIVGALTPDFDVHERVTMRSER